MGMIEQFEALLAQGQDNAPLRFGLGNAYLKAGDTARAIDHLRVAVDQNPHYSAAWKLLGKAMTEAGRSQEAMAVYEQGAQIAERKGDIQAAREMKVFLKRLRRSQDDQ